MADIFTYQLVRNIFNLHYCPFLLSSLLLSLFAFHFSYLFHLPCFVCIRSSISISNTEIEEKILEEKSQRVRTKRGVNQSERQAASVSETEGNLLGALGLCCHCLAVVVSPNSPTETC